LNGASAYRSIPRRAEEEAVERRREDESGVDDARGTFPGVVVVAPPVVVPAAAAQVGVGRVGFDVVDYFQGDQRSGWDERKKNRREKSGL